MPPEPNLSVCSLHHVHGANVRDIGMLSNPTCEYYVHQAANFVKNLWRCFLWHAVHIRSVDLVVDSLKSVMLLQMSHGAPTAVLHRPTPQTLLKAQ
jgi:hypothetical protein